MAATASSSRTQMRDVDMSDHLFSGMAPIDDNDVDDEDDPVVGEYSVYITSQSGNSDTKATTSADASSAEKRRNVYLLQFPNRSSSMPYREDTPQAPLAVRVKPKAGFMEMDLTVPTGVHLDRSKAVKWSQALRDAEAEGITEFGMSAGFTSRVVSARTGFGGGGGDRSEFDRENEAIDLLESFEDSDRQGKVLNKQVVGGQILKNTSGRPFYMIGAFRKDTLHLSPLSGVVQLRPQFHYLDAQKKLDFLRKRKEAGGPGGPGGEEPRQPKAIQQVVKADEDGAGGADGDGTRSFLQAAQDEPWMPLPFVGEDTNLAYDVYNEWLFVNDPDNVPDLQSTWTDSEYLDAISVPHFDPIARTRRKPLTKEQIRQIAEEKNAR